MSHTAVAKTNNEQDRIIREHELRSIVPYSSMHIWRLERAGRFPRRIKLGPNRVGWSLQEIADWLDARKNNGVSFCKRLNLRTSCYAAASISTNHTGRRKNAMIDEKPLPQN